MIHMRSRGFTEDTHTEQRIHRGYTYRTEDIHTEQRIHRGYIQSRVYTIHLQSRGQWQKKSRGRNTRAEAGAGTVTRTEHFQGSIS